jgi:hypothetical protein
VISALERRTFGPVMAVPIPPPTRGTEAPMPSPWTGVLGPATFNVKWNYVGFSRMLREIASITSAASDAFMGLLAVFRGCPPGPTADSRSVEPSLRSVPAGRDGSSQIRVSAT